MSGAGPIALSKRLVVINSASSVLNRILAVTVLVWMYQHLIKTVPTEEFAIYPVLTAIMIFAPLLFSLFTGGLARYVIDAYAKSEFHRVTEVISSVLPLIAGAVGLLWLIGLVFVMNIEHVLVIPPDMVSEARLMMGLLIFSFGMLMLLNPFMLGFHITQSFVELNILEAFRELLRIVLLLTLLFGIGPQVMWVVVANVAAELIHLTIAVYRSRRKVPQLRFDRRAFDMRKALSLTSFGLWTALGQLGDIMYTNAATILLNLYGTPVDVTCFFLGATIYRQTEMLIIRAIGPLLPVITAMNAIQDKARLSSTVLRGGRYGLWASMLVATPAVIYADEFVNLYAGPQFGQATIVIILFMAILPFKQSVALLPMTAVAKAWVKPYFGPAFLFQLAGLIAMIVLLRWFETGAIGAAFALAAITIGAHLFYYWRLCLRMVDATFGTFVGRVLVPGLLPAAVGAVAWGALRAVVTIDGWLMLFAVGAVGGLAYFGALIAFCLEPGEKASLHRMIAALANRFRKAAK